MTCDNDISLTTAYKTFFTWHEVITMLYIGLQEVPSRAQASMVTNDDIVTNNFTMQ